LQRALNSLLPNDIVVRDLVPAPDDFDPRHDARSRLYEYRVLNLKIASAFEYRYSWLVRDHLDLVAMNASAQVFVGEHDFAAFRSLGSSVKSTVRRVLASEWTRTGDVLVYRIEANSFLRHMVRAMVAAMVEAGHGRVDARKIAEILEGRDRHAAPANAPPGGLYLIEVRY
jgi:tRNA pseudouridine38-40 synthase